MVRGAVEGAEAELSTLERLTPEEFYQKKRKELTEKRRYWEKESRRKEPLVLSLDNKIKSKIRVAIKKLIKELEAGLSALEQMTPAEVYEKEKSRLIAEKEFWQGEERQLVNA